MTHLLYPALRKADHARVVNVASKAHSYGKIKHRRSGYSKNYHGLKSNGQSKLANIYFTFELEARKPDKKYQCVCSLSWFSQNGYWAKAYQLVAYGGVEVQAP
jgi:NAD(P)-dependent dehydrogenase (short-subunit alcohol dehydrogenase family)